MSETDTRAPDESRDLAARTPSWLKAMIRYGLFPVNFAVALGAAFMAVEKGWDPSITLICITAPTVVIISIAERLSPYHRSWNHGLQGGFLLKETVLTLQYH